MEHGLSSGVIQEIIVAGLWVFVSAIDLSELIASPPMMFSDID
jgi:hypothetical protein